MIRVNLLPGGKKQGRGGGLSLSLPSFGAGAMSDPWIISGVVVPIVLLIGAYYLYSTIGAAEDQMVADIDVQHADSVRFSAIAAQTDLLQQQNVDVVEKVTIIQEIDEGRYVWPHIMDEIARALPDYTWLVGVTQVNQGSSPDLRIRGRAGNNIAVTVFMEQLEASPFIRDIGLLQTTQVVEGAQVVYAFELDASYEQPTSEFLNTVPLFGGDVVGTEADSAQAQQADTTGLIPAEILPGTE